MFPRPLIACANPWSTQPEFVGNALLNAQFTFLQSPLPQHSLEQRDQIASRGQLACQSGSGLEVQVPPGTCCRLSLPMQMWGQEKCVQGAAEWVISNCIQFPLLRTPCPQFPKTSRMTPFHPFNTHKYQQRSYSLVRGRQWSMSRNRDEEMPSQWKGLKWQGKI